MSRPRICRGEVGSNLYFELKASGHGMKVRSSQYFDTFCWKLDIKNRPTSRKIFGVHCFC